jgi:hypothetical protein
MTLGFDATNTSKAGAMKIERCISTACGEKLPQGFGIKSKRLSPRDCLREIARNINIPEGTVLAHAK